MLKGRARRRKREGRDGIQARWGGHRVGTGRRQVGRGGVKGRVGVRGWSRDSDRLLRMIESWSPCSTRILLCGLICYKQGEKTFSQWVHNRGAGFICLCFLLYLTHLSSCPFPLKPLTCLAKSWLPQPCLRLQDWSKPQPATGSREPKDCLGCKDSYSPPDSPAQSHHATRGGAGAHRRCSCGCFLDYCNLHDASEGRENPAPGLHKGKAEAKEVKSSLWKWMQAHSLSLWALQLNFTASSLPIYAHFFLPRARTVSPLLWTCQHSAPFLTHLYYCPCLLIPFLIFMESQWELDGPGAHRWVGSLFARPVLLFQDSHWGVSDPSTPLGKASWGVSLRPMGRHFLSRGDSAWQKVPDVWTPPRNDNSQMSSQELLPPPQEMWDHLGLNLSNPKEVTGYPQVNMAASLGWPTWMGGRGELLLLTLRVRWPGPCLWIHAVIGRCGLLRWHVGVNSTWHDKPWRRWVVSL